MSMMSHTGQASSLIGTFHEATIAFVQTWTMSYKRRRRLMQEAEELRHLDPRILADLGVEFAPEFGPTMLHSQAEAVTAATNAMAASVSLPTRR
jgi:hypothetical protein